MKINKKFLFLFFNCVYYLMIDLKYMFEERINEDVKKANPTEYEKIQEELKESKKAEMDARKKKIAMLAEQYKNDSAIIAVLNKAAKDLALLENE
jgi:mannose-6-phosphate isomerase class I